MKTLTAALTLLVLTLSACTETIVQEAPDVCEELGATSTQCRLMKQGRIATGMTQDMVRESWGERDSGTSVCPITDGIGNMVGWWYGRPTDWVVIFDYRTCRVEKIMECNGRGRCWDGGSVAP